MKTIYISGAISNEDPQKEAANVARFAEVAKWLKRTGHKVHNPAAYKREGWTWEMYLAYDLKWIHDHLPTMYFMEGWRDSRGSRLEYEYALLLNLNITYEE